jgi:hypothetical protein
MVAEARAMNAASVPPTDDLAAGVSLDALFRANALARPEAMAVSDPPGRGRYTDSEPRCLTYAAADAEVDRLARRLQSFGLPSGSIVVVQLPNIAESVLSLLAILRAGLTAAPVPMAWRRSDLVAALAGMEPKALVTLVRFGDERPAESACEAAVELFHLSFPCAFGAPVPDGMIALDGDIGTQSVPPPAPVKAEAVAVVTFDAAANGFFACARGHSQWLAAGLATLLEARIESGDTIATAIPPNSLTGIGAAFVPWLLSGGMLELRDGGAGAPNDSKRRAHLVAPAVAAGEIAERAGIRFASCITVHRGQPGGMRDFSALPCERVVDFLAFGEIGAIALCRDHPARQRPIPLGPISAPTSAGSAPVVIETRIRDGELLLRGPMVPRGEIPAAAAGPRMVNDASGFVHTGFRCRAEGNSGFVVESGPRRVATIGGLRFGLDDLSSRIANCVGAAKVQTIGDSLLGERLRIEVHDLAAVAAALQARGHSRLVIEALTPADARRRVTG